MAGIDGPVNGVNTQGYFKLDWSTLTSTGATWGEVNGTGKLVSAANKVDVLDPLDALGAQPNSQSYGVFGLQTKRRIAGQADPADFIVRLEFNKDSGVPALGYTNGSKCMFGMLAKETASKQTLVMQRCTIAGRQIEFQVDGPAIVLLGLAPYDDLQVVNQA